MQEERYLQSKANRPEKNKQSIHNFVKEKIMEKTCKTCINNDDGLCDRRGILVEDEDSCEKHREDWREAMLRQFNRRR